MSFELFFTKFAILPVKAGIALTMVGDLLNRRDLTRYLLRCYDRETSAIRTAWSNPTRIDCLTSRAYESLFAHANWRVILYLAYTVNPAISRRTSFNGLKICYLMLN